MVNQNIYTVIFINLYIFYTKYMLIVYNRLTFVEGLTRGEFNSSVKNFKTVGLLSNGKLNILINLGLSI